MKILGIDNFVSERIKVLPVTNAELEKVQKEFEESKNPFGLTKDDLIAQLKDFPIGVVVRILEEQKKQGNMPNVVLFQEHGAVQTDKKKGGFTWYNTEAGYVFWKNVLKLHKFDIFFERYPEYRKYNLD